jgi:hypothetical protein
MRARDHVVVDFHVPIELIWGVSKGESQFTPEEHAHVVRCVYCVSALILCPVSESPKDVREQLANSWRLSA